MGKIFVSPITNLSDLEQNLPETSQENKLKGEVEDSAAWREQTRQVEGQQHIPPQVKVTNLCFFWQRKES
jgi:hypothetical protein